jgi:hypothetical protein
MADQHVGARHEERAYADCFCGADHPQHGIA